MKMETIIACAICLLIGLGGGGLIGYNVAPKTINNIQNVYNQNTLESRTESIQYAMQGQITVVSAVTNLNVNIKGITNFIVSYSTNSNFTSITNTVH
jgi:predicted PurR-regulated permease PerM